MSILFREQAKKVQLLYLNSLMEVDEVEVEVESRPSSRQQDGQFVFSDEEEEEPEDLEEEEELEDLKEPEDLEEDSEDEEEEVLTSTPQDQTAPAALTYGDIFGKWCML